MAGHDMGAYLREPPLRGILEAVEDGACDRELENAVPEELEPLVRLGAVARPGRVGENLLESSVRKPGDQAAELSRPVLVASLSPGAR
jgi:hypothetical protein